MIRVSILMPLLSYTPIGGYKVAYEIGTRLSERGYRVTFLHPRNYTTQSTPVEVLHGLLWKLRYGGRKSRQQVQWFDFPAETSLQLAPNFEPRWCPSTDVLIATGWQTAEWAQNFPVSPKRKFFNLYDYEVWKHAEATTKAKIETALCLPLHFVATGCAATELLTVVGQTPVALIPCGLDFNLLKIKVPVAGRKRGRIGFPYRKEAYKGAGDAVSAYTELRQKYGDTMQFTAFGSSREPDLPDWIEYSQGLSDAALVDYYNSLSIFVAPSHYEGWGLPGAEAMACGCALVSTDSVGSRDYALPEITALVSPPKEPQVLADHIERLWLDDAERLRFANAGHEFVQKFKWDRCIDDWERLLNQG